MITLTVYAPADLANRVVASMEAMPGVHRLVRLPSAVVRSGDDLVAAGLEPDHADEVIDELLRLGVGRSRIVLSDSALAIVEPRAREAATLWDHDDDAVVWEEARDDALLRSRLSASYLILMAVAGLIAAVGVFEDQPVLIVGAMAVSPDILPVTAACMGFALGSPTLARRALLTLFLGFLMAASAGAVAVIIGRFLGESPTASGFGTGILTSFVSHPHLIGAVIAAAAGLAAILSFEGGRAGIAVGVAISVTTIPAAAGLGVAIGLENWPRVLGSLEVLLINVTFLIIGGAVTIVVQRAWRARRDHGE